MNTMRITIIYSSHSYILFLTLYLDETNCRVQLREKDFTQIPQLSSMNPIDVNTKFDLVPDTATGTKRAVMIGINYVGKLI